MTELSKLPQVGDNESRRGRSEAIRAFLQQFGGTENDDLLYQMLVTICRLAQDDTDRGDLKLLNTALKELRYSFKIFRAYADVPKVSIFGSARTPEGHPQYEEARKFAELIEAAGWMVITGAGDGIMRAGHHGAKREASFGVSISLPFEQKTNSIIEGDSKLINFKYFFTRKLMFVKEAKAIVLFPGGFGTQDEGFEALTLVQTGKSAPLPVVLCDEPGGTYWQHWRTYVKAELLGNHMIDKEDLNLFTVTDRAEDAVEVVTRYYRRYHSARYVGDLMVMRLSSPLPAGRLDQINREYADILMSGVYEVHDAALPEEDGEFANLPRLVFAFNRRSAGKLRRMIDLINQD
jgi:uncharacterized protein (TIGR00730 family)